MTRISLPDGRQGVETAFVHAREERRCALITYLTVGYPSPESTPALVAALQDGGSDIIELGMPFSDPVADGPVIQRSDHQALQAGVTPATCVQLVARLRAEGIGAPLVLMGYLNPMLAYGLGAFVRDCAAAGANGFIVPDLPLEEAGELNEACVRHGLALVFLVAPTTPSDRIARIARSTSGFLYVVSRLGITGAQSGPQDDLGARLSSIRQHAHTPVAVGFGLSRPEQVRAIANHADGVIIGSAIVERAADGPDALRGYVATLHAALSRT